MPADILLYGLIAAGLVFWLRNILGTRHGDENQRPNPFAQEKSSLENKYNPANKPEDTPENAFGITAEQANPLKNVVIESKAVENTLQDIAWTDKTFDLQNFITGAQDAFIIIVEAFAGGDRETLQNLLSEDTYKVFDRTLSEREQRGETVSTEIHAVRKAEILDASIKEKMIYITVRFAADETCVIRDSGGEIISGNPDRVTEMVDIWTFGREVKSKDPRWLVYETRDGDPEDHKTPVPDAS